MKAKSVLMGSSMVDPPPQTFFFPSPLPNVQRGGGMMPWYANATIQSC